MRAGLVSRTPSDSTGSPSGSLGLPYEEPVALEPCPAMANDDGRPQVRPAPGREGVGTVRPCGPVQPDRGAVGNDEREACHAQLARVVSERVDDDPAQHASQHTCTDRLSQAPVGEAKVAGVGCSEWFATIDKDHMTYGDTERKGFV